MKIQQRCNVVSLSPDHPKPTSVPPPDSSLAFFLNRGQRSRMSGIRRYQVYLSRTLEPRWSCLGRGTETAGLPRPVTSNALSIGRFEGPPSGCTCRSPAPPAAHHQLTGCWATRISGRTSFCGRDPKSKQPIWLSQCNDCRCGAGWPAGAAYTGTKKTRGDAALWAGGPLNGPAEGTVIRGNRRRLHGKKRTAASALPSP